MPRGVYDRSKNKDPQAAPVKTNAPKSATPKASPKKGGAKPGPKKGSKKGQKAASTEGMMKYAQPHGFNEDFGALNSLNSAASTLTGILATGKANPGIVGQALDQIVTKIAAVAERIEPSPKQAQSDDDDAEDDKSNVTTAPKAVQTKAPSAPVHSQAAFVPPGQQAAAQA